MTNKFLIGDNLKMEHSIINQILGALKRNLTKEEEPIRFVNDIIERIILMVTVTNNKVESHSIAILCLTEPHLNKLKIHLMTH